MKQSIIKFQGPYRFLSNFHPVRVEMDGLEYPTVEHAYQAAKTLDRARRRAICFADSPGQAKRLGQQVTLREGWDRIKVRVMDELLCQKFSQPDLRDALVNTEGMLVEGNYWHDNFWGVCYCKQCPGAGHNHLGRLLMKVREEVQYD